MCKCGIPWAILGCMLNQSPADVTALYSRPRSHKELVETMTKVVAVLAERGVFDGD